MDKRFLGLVIAGIITLTGCSSTEVTEEATPPPSDTKVEEPKDQSPVRGKVGETMNVSGIDITINSIEEYPAPSNITLEEGETLYSINVTMLNNREADATFSTLLCAEAIDMDGQKCSQKLVTDEVIDGSLLVGIAKTGNIYYASKTPVQALTLRTELGGDKQVFLLQ